MDLFYNQRYPEAFRVQQTVPGKPKTPVDWNPWGGDGGFPQLRVVRFCARK